MINYLCTSPELIYISAPRQQVCNYGQMAGSVRFNTTTQNLEAFDGVTWINISAPGEISLSHETQELLAWAKKKKKEDEKRALLMEKYPAVKDLKEKLDAMVNLVKEAE